MKLLPRFLLLFCPALALPPLLAGAESFPDPRQPPTHYSDAQKAQWSPLGLPRLRTQVPAGKASALGAAVFEVDALEVPTKDRASGSMKTEKEGNVGVLKIAPSAELVRPLRTSPQQVSFHSFLIYASQSTVVSVGGAWLGFAASPIGDMFQVTYGEGTPEGLVWKSASLHVSLDVYGGQSLATLPVLTVRLDPKAGVWDLYAGSRLVFANIALLSGAKPADANKFILRGGTAGAWLVGLVQSDENPIFEDANRNGIDDAFELEQGGQLLAATASKADRGALAERWKADSFQKRQDAWLIDRPRPDRLQAPSTR